MTVLFVSVPSIICNGDRLQIKNVAGNYASKSKYFARFHEKFVPKCHDYSFVIPNFIKNSEEQKITVKKL